MKKVIKNNYKIAIGIIIGIVLSVTTTYAIDAYIESNKVSFDNKHTKTNNVQDAIDELYERSGIHKEKWVDKELNGADPVLQDPLIPVEIKPNGEVYYANLNSEWYNYSEKRWANAIILVDNPSNTNYEVGDHIKEDDIESYFVWIPRYQYKIWNLANTDEYSKVILGSELADNELYKLNSDARIIDIKFGSAEKIPKMNESEAAIDKYYTHPAFTLGDKNLNGIWVSKFEIGYKGAKNVADASVDNSDITKVIIKPNVQSWRSIKVKNMFITSYKYERNLDSHMLKNTEWGAVAYLSYSAYGLGSEINLNNNSDYKTGYSAVANTPRDSYVSESSNSPLKTQPYNTTIGYLASTTGNISGIYDMNGGSWEYVAGCIEDAPGESGFDTIDLSNYMNQGYIDKYSKSNNEVSYNHRILGDATGEVGPFYRYQKRNNGILVTNSWDGGWSNFVISENRSDNGPWFCRSGWSDGNALSSQFAFFSHGGEARGGSFRISLAINS